MNSDQDKGITMADLIFDLLYNTKIGFSIAFIPVAGWFFHFLERLVEMMFVLAILLIGGFISLVSSLFKK